MRKKRDCIVAFFSALFVVTLLCLNAKSYFKMLEVIPQALEEKQDIAQISDQWSDILRESFWNKDGFADIYGAVERSLGKNIIGNFEYIKDNLGILHMYSEVGDYSNLPEEIKYLKEYCDELNTPLMYVQMAPRLMISSQFNGDYAPNDNRTAMQHWVNAISNLGIYVLDYEKDIVNQEKLEPGNVYFKTDAHMTTDAEWALLEELTNVLQNEYNITLSNVDTVLNRENYIVDTRDFLGNFARSVGQYFTGTDQFDMLVPKFETHLKYFNSDGNLERFGNFEDALMNGYEKDPLASTYTYWVTNYGHFMSDTYRYENEDVPDGCDLLFIMDSQGYRTISYLSLMCHSITVVDPRYSPTGQALTDVLNNSTFDAVIVMCGYDTNFVNLPLLFDQGRTIEDYQSEITSVSDDGDLIKVTVYNFSDFTWTRDLQIRCGVFVDGQDSGIRSELTREVLPGESTIFTFKKLDLPAGNIQVQMLHEGICYFGERRDILGVMDGLDAEIISNTAPATVNHQDSYTINITVKNTGSINWSESQQIRLCIWQDGVDYGYRQSIPDGVTVNPGEEYTFTLSGFVLPEADSTYLEFQMVQEGVRYFGEKERVDITAVSGN